MNDSITHNGIDYTVIDVTKHSVFAFVEEIRAKDGAKLGYKVTENLAYYSPRYECYILIEVGDRSDGATFAKDIDSFYWLVHDECCATGKFSDGSKMNNAQASAMAYDILIAQRKWLWAPLVLFGTWLFGGGKARKNGMI